MNRRSFYLAVALLLVGLAGCGGDSRPEVVPASGQVMFQKTRPAEGALVVLHPKDPEVEKKIGGKPMAKVGADGSFKFTTYAEGDGAPAGEYGVTVEWRAAAKTGSSTGEVASTGALLTNPKYGNPQAPFLTVIVKKGEPNEFKIDVD